MTIHDISPHRLAALERQMHGEGLTASERRELNRIMEADPMNELRLHRRVSGWHDLRMDGLGDLLTRAGGASVLDVGCNRGLVGYEFAWNGARLVHGVDNYEDGITTARHLFLDNRGVQAKFEVVDLAQGIGAFDDAFGRVPAQYDIVLLLGVIHKLERQMEAAAWRHLIREFGQKTAKLLGWRGFPKDLEMMDAQMAKAGLERVAYSTLSDLGPTGIWRRKQ